MPTHTNESVGNHNTRKGAVLLGQKGQVKVFLEHLYRAALFFVIEYRLCLYAKAIDI